MSAGRKPHGHMARWSQGQKAGGSGRVSMTPVTMRQPPAGEHTLHRRGAEGTYAQFFQVGRPGQLGHPEQVDATEGYDGESLSRLRTSMEQELGGGLRISAIASRQQWCLTVV